MSRAHDNFRTEQERGYQRLRCGPRVGPMAPDDWSATHGACLLWIRRQGWMGKVDDWMIDWVMGARLTA